MENRLEVQNIQGDELFMELTPEELQELEQLKGGALPYPPGSFPLGIVTPEHRSRWDSGANATWF